MIEIDRHYIGKCGWEIRDDGTGLVKDSCISWVCHTKDKCLVVKKFLPNDEICSRELSRPYCKCNTEPKLAQIYHQLKPHYQKSTTPVIGNRNLTPHGRALFNQWYSEGKFVDYYLTCGDLRIGVHRAFLALISPMFRKEFDSKYGEDGSNHTNEFDLQVESREEDEFGIRTKGMTNNNERSPKLAKKFVDFLYSGQISLDHSTTDLTQHDELEILELSHYFQLQGAEEWINNYNLNRIEHNPVNLTRYAQLVLASDDKITPYILADQLNIHRITNLEWLDVLRGRYPEVELTQQYLEFLGSF